MVYGLIRLQIDLRDVKIENITFYEKINIFLKKKKKGQGNPQPTYTGQHLCTLRIQASTCIRRPTPAYAGIVHAYAGTYMRMQLRFQKPMKDKFFVLMLRFGMNPTSFGSHSKPLFSHYIKPYMTPFQNIQKILRENLRFTRNSESKREFFTKYP